MPTVDINGTNVEFDPKWANSWEVAELITSAQDGSGISEYQKLSAMFRVVELCTGLTHDQFIELAGGADTDRDEMAQRLGNTIAHLVSKN